MNARPATRRISTNEWSPAPGGDCDDGVSCTDNDRCTEDGGCVGESRAPTTGLECTYASCVERPGEDECVSDIDSGYCLIDGACYALGDRNPENDCESCEGYVFFASCYADRWCDRLDGDACVNDGYLGTCLGGVCVP